MSINIEFQNPETLELINSFPGLNEKINFALSSMRLHHGTNDDAVIHSIIVNAALHCREQAGVLEAIIGRTQDFLPQSTYTAKSRYDRLADLLNTEARLMMDAA